MEIASAVGSDVARNKKRGIFLTYYFPPVGGSSVQRAHKFARYLPEEGYLPIVIAGPLNRKDPWAQIDPTLSMGTHSEVLVNRVESNPPNLDNRLREKLSRWLALPDPLSQWWGKSAADLASKARPVLVSSSLRCLSVKMPLWPMSYRGV